jgi:dienelactone hydrolase
VILTWPLATLSRCGGRGLFAALLFFISFSIAAQPAGEIVPSIACARDPEMTYAYYLPRAYRPDRAWPVLFIFDPRSRGAFAAELFRDAAEKLGWILVSSNNTRSDDPAAPNARAVGAMWDDVHSRFTTDRKRVYATGFSGGAILAWLLAANSRSVAGVIAVGGRVQEPEKITGPVRFDWYGVAGTTDFNLPEMRRVEERLLSASSSHRLETFDGGHRWAPKEQLHHALEWMEGQAMKRGLRARDEELMAQLVAADLAFAAATDDRLESMRRFEAIARTYDSGEARERAAAIRAASAALLADERNGEKLEKRFRDRLPGILNRFLQAPDISTATDVLRELEIDRLQKMAKEKTYTGRAAERILETIYVQVEFYLPQSTTGATQMLLKSVAEKIRPAKARG